MLRLFRNASGDLIALHGIDAFAEPGNYEVHP